MSDSNGPGSLPDKYLDVSLRGSGLCDRSNLPADQCEGCHAKTGKPPVFARNDKIVAFAGMTLRLKTYKKEP
jgi:hypothetical protein